MCFHEKTYYNYKLPKHSCPKTNESFLCDLYKVSLYPQKTTKYLIILLLIILLNPAYSQRKEIRFEHLTTKDGLPQGYVTTIDQDKFGFLWFGTQDGLVKYDGYKFIEYRYKQDDTNSISDNWITKIAVDSKNNIWVGTGGKGVSKITPAEKIIRYPFNVNDGTGLNAGFVSDILVDKEEIIWLATSAGGLAKYDSQNEKFKYFTNNEDNSNSLSDNDASILYEDSKGFIWIGTKNSGLDRFDKNKEIFYNYKHINTDTTSLVFNQVSSICEDNQGKLWIGTYGKGLDRFDPVTEEFSHYKPGNSNIYGLADSLISRVYCDTDGNIWICTDENGVYIYDKKFNYFHNYSPNLQDPTSIGDNRIWSIYEDKLGIIWVGGFTGGLSKFDKNKNWFKHYKSIPNNNNSLKDNFVKAILIDKHKKLWVGHNKGITLIDRKNNTYNHLFENFNNSNNTKVRAICEDTGGLIWIGTWGNGLIKYEHSKGRYKQYAVNPSDEHSLSANLIRDIYIDSKNQLWVCTTAGLNKYDRSNDQFDIIKINFNKDNSLNSNLLYKIIEDFYGDYWIGTAAGLVRYNPGYNSFEIFLHSPEDSGSISDNRIRSIIKDSQNRLWVGTFGGGLNKFNYFDSSFTSYSTKSGLSSNVIYEIVEDDNYHLWLSTNNGLSRFNPDKKTFRNYSIRDGLQNKEFNGGASFKSSDGEILFGGVNGFNSFYLDDVVKNNNIFTPLVITEFSILNEAITPQSHPGILSDNINSIDKIQLEHNQNFISFEFASLRFSLPDIIKYKYYLEGLEKKWNYTSSKIRFANYTNLSPGDYTFKAAASNDEGVWLENGISLSITVLPPWWLTWWANTIYLVLIISLIIVSTAFQKKQLRVKSEIRLKELENEKLKEIFQMKSKFYDNISHEFRTPLTLILGPIERLKRKETDAGLQRLYSYILKNSERLLKLINELLYLSKLESGTMKLTAQLYDIVSFSRAMVLSFKLLAAKKNIKIKFDYNKEIIRLYFDKEKMSQIISNLMSNAIKYTQANGKINVIIEEKPHLGRLFIKVKDTGIGISKSDIPKIFDRFFQTGNLKVKSTKGTGIGLSLTKQLVNLHHGTIKVESKLEEGTTFTLSLPLGKKHLNDKEILIDSDEYKSIYFEKSKDSISSAEKSLLLLVDDDAEIRKYIIEILNDNYKIIEAENGKDGFQKALRQVPDLIISDILMPVVDGSRMCEKLKQNIITCHIPIILLTAKVSENEKISGLEHGADAYLTKPFNDLELIVIIRNLIDQRKKLRERYLREAEIHPTEVAVTSLDKEFICKVINFIDNNISNPNLNVNDLVEHLAISRAQLFRKFSSVLGEKPYDFIRKYRVKRAADLIKQNFGNIAQVAYEVGFNDPAHFTKCFKAVFNKKPFEYKNQISQKHHK